ncbi:unnamed protein product [Gongylonema pulchrum]|uniref:DUF148 domain-containing protein n=1 Tax=Gongylonema pulchrum TaxID=637853 RepID=A0A183EZ33_9BILA|nr:unnamed protein product [Gongylonema pulchrum]
MPQQAQEFNPNLYSVAYGMPSQPLFPVGIFGTTTSRVRSHPFQSFSANALPVFTNQREYIGYVAELKKDADAINDTVLTQPSASVVDVNPFLPEFLQGTPREVQKKFREIVSNPDESFQQKQTKLDQLVAHLDIENQEQYNQYRKIKEVEEREKRQRVHAIVANMSRNAQAVFSKVATEILLALGSSNFMCTYMNVYKCV